MVSRHLGSHLFQSLKEERGGTDADAGGQVVDAEEQTEASSQLQREEHQAGEYHAGDKGRRNFLCHLCGQVGDASVHAIAAFPAPRCTLPAQQSCSECHHYTHEFSEWNLRFRKLIFCIGVSAGMLLNPILARRAVTLFIHVNNLLVYMRYTTIGS